MSTPTRAVKTNPVPTNLTVQRLLRNMRAAGFTVSLASAPQLRARLNRPGVRHRAPAASPSVLGVIVPDENAILINRTLSLEERVKTVLHELIHLAEPLLSENKTKLATQKLFTGLTEHQRGYLEFLVS